MHKSADSLMDGGTGLGILLGSGCLLAWLAAIALEASTPAAATWSAPWIGAYALAVATGLFGGSAAPPGPSRWIGHAGVALTVTGAVLRTVLHDPAPPASGILSAVDIPFWLAVGLNCVAVVLGSRAARTDHRRRDTGMAVAIGLLLVWIATLLTEYVARPNLWHGTEFYVVSGAALPLVLVFAATAVRGKWSATTAAAVYMVLNLVAAWGFQAITLPGDMSNPGSLERLLPPPFPLVLVLPALVVDGILRRASNDVRWWWRRVAVGSVGPAFVLVMVSVHWPLADFLLSPPAQNAMFGADQWPYYAELGEWRYQYWTLAPSTRSLAAGFTLAAALSIASASIGSWLGRVAASRR